MTDSTTDATIISDRYRQPLIAQRKRGGDGIILRNAKPAIFLSNAELDRLFGYVNGLGILQNYAPKTGPESPQTHE